MSRFFRERLRNRRITSGQVRILERLWKIRIRREGKRPDLAMVRCKWRKEVSGIVGRPVGTAQELGWREANQVIERWLQETAGQAPLPKSECLPPRTKEQVAAQHS